MTAPHFYEFTVEELPEGRRRAVHHADAALVVAAESWQDLERDCMVAWLLRTWRLADEQHVHADQRDGGAGAREVRHR